jgi:hypothetical protein
LRYSDNTTLHFGAIAKCFMMWRKVFASKSYRSGQKETVITSDNYCSGII